MCELPEGSKMKLAKRDRHRRRLKYLWLLRRKIKVFEGIIGLILSRHNDLPDEPQVESETK